MKGSFNRIVVVFLAFVFVAMFCQTARGEATFPLLVSITPDGSSYPGSFGLSADGQRVVFLAGHSVAGGNWWNNVYLRDLATSQTTYVNVAMNGGPTNQPAFYPPRISADGWHVSFSSGAWNIVPGDNSDHYWDSNDIFVRDLTTGITERVSIATDGTPANNSSSNSSLSADGRFVAFESRATNLIAGVTISTSRVSDIYVHDRSTGTTEIASLTSSGPISYQGNSPAISANGRFVAFIGSYSLGSGVTPPTGFNPYQVFVHDRLIGTTEIVSIASNGDLQSNGIPQDCHK